MGSDFFDRLAALTKEGRPFAVATVVARRAPVSAHLGDRALIFADGRMEGFVGGACAREIVRQQAIDAIRTRRARLVSISPDPESPGSSDEHVVVAMTCASEGAVDVYVEPFVRARAVVVAGSTPVAAAVARLARAMDFDVVRVVDAREQADVQAQTTGSGLKVATLDGIAEALAGIGPEAAAVVASQGHYDEEALAAVLRAGLSYVGLVASRTRGSMVCGLLEERGVPGVSGVRFPAGLDLGAKTPPEVALSILAEIIQRGQIWKVGVFPQNGVRHEVWKNAHFPDLTPAVTPAVTPRDAAGTAAFAIDPVCHMQVEIATARHTAEVDGVTYYFCCAGCESRFVKEPHAFRPAPTP